MFVLGPAGDHPEAIRGLHGHFGIDVIVYKLNVANSQPSNECKEKSVQLCLHTLQ